VHTPTLVLHARRDEIVPFEAGKHMAASIANAEFVQLDSRNHVLLADEPAWAQFKEAVLEFTGRPPSNRAEDPLLASLSARERQILAAVVAGQSNSQIGTTLFVSEKTVRNSLTRIFEKLGVHTRTQAAVMARDLGLTLTPTEQLRTGVSVQSRNASLPSASSKPSDPRVLSAKRRLPP